MMTPRRPHALSRSLQALLLLLALATAGLGCGGAATPQALTPIGHEDLITLLPDESEGLALIDVSAVRSARFMSMLDEALSPHMNPQLTQARELLDRVDRIAIAFGQATREDGRDRVLVVARGNFNDADLETLAASHQPGTHRGHAIRRDGHQLLAVAQGHTLMYGTDRWVLAALDRLDGALPTSRLSRPVLVDAARRVGMGRHSVTFAIEVPESFELERISPVPGHGVSLGGWADMGEPIQMQAFGLFTDEATASAVAQSMRDTIAEAETSPDVVGTGFERLFANASIVANGSTVDVTYSIDNDMFGRVLMAMVLGVQAFAAASDTVAE